MGSLIMRVNEPRNIGSGHSEKVAADELTAIENFLNKRYSPTLFACAIGLITVLIASLLLFTHQDKQAALNQIKTIHQSLLVKDKIVQFIAQNQQIIQDLRSFLLRRSQVSSDEYREFSEALVRNRPYINRILWAPSATIANVYPLGLNKNLISTAIPNTVINGLIEAKGDLLIRIDLERDQLTSFVLYSLLFREKPFSNGNGVLSLDLDLYHYLKAEIGTGQPQQLAFKVEDNRSGKVIFRVGEQHLISYVSAYNIKVVVGDQLWNIQTEIKQQSAISFWRNWIIAMLLAIFLALMSYRIICTYKQRSVDVEAGAYRANFDLLTGLPNRYHLSRRLGEAIFEAKRDQQDFAVFFMDIDHFKQMNDQLGQGAGDALLTAFSARLEFAAKSTDIVARISGDEFVFVACDVDDVIKADLLAEKMKKHLQQPIEFAGQQHFLTVSIGVAMYPIDGEDVATLLHHSDQAMYAAKRAGRNRHFFFNEGMREQAQSYSLIHEDLLRGLQAGEFELYYQPVMNIKTETIEFCEALIRWNHPEKGLVMPDKFIPVAERTGAIREIGNWAFGQACRDIRKFTESDISIKISINHSISEYYSSRAFESWKKILSENFVTGDKFIFEIPETLLMDKKSVRMSVVTAMRKMGVQFAIDDFGTGHSAINYLRNYPAEILKIDSSLIQGMQQNDKDRTLVEVVLILAKSLGKVVVAEGVENDQVAAILKELGCGYLQGNWLLEPKPINRLIPYIHQHIFELEDRRAGEANHRS